MNPNPVIAVFDTTLGGQAPYSDEDGVKFFYDLLWLLHQPGYEHATILYKPKHTLQAMATTAPLSAHARALCRFHPRWMECGSNE